MNADRKSILLFGTGCGGRNGYNHLKRSYRIRGFVDNATGKQGTQFMGLPVFAPSEIKRMEVNHIVVCSMHTEQIMKQLTTQLNIPFENIYILDPDIRKYGQGHPFGSLFVLLATIAGISIAIWKLTQGRGI